MYLADSLLGDLSNVRVGPQYTLFETPMLKDNRLRQQDPTIYGKKNLNYGNLFGENKKNRKNHKNSICSLTCTLIHDILYMLKVW